MKGTKKICEKGHEFYKSSDCPICPICWSGYYKGQYNLEFLQELSAPAQRALLSAKITTLQKLSTFSEKEILELHGIGPKSIPTLKHALNEKRLEFKS